ncbi:MAG: bifunctional pyr operon transcriptional regulator/uracil phosphoribosyltransferase PyrR [Thiotrichales bacterium]
MTETFPADALVEELAAQTRALITTRGLAAPAMVGVHTGGAWVAQRLHRLLGLEQPLGTLDISFYRDDFTRKGLNPLVKPSNLPFDIDDRNILLVDDVLHTGRTVRAAMNELFDYGRPASIVLIVLAERPGRELPIEPAICGRHFALAAHQHIKLTGPDSLRLEVLDS